MREHKLWFLFRNVFCNYKGIYGFKLNYLLTNSMVQLIYYNSCYRYTMISKEKDKRKVIN